MGLGHFSAALPAEDISVSAAFLGLFCVFVALRWSEMPSVRVCSQTHSKLAKCKRHMALVAANLNEDWSILGKGSSDFVLESLVVVQLSKIGGKDAGRGGINSLCVHGRDFGLWRFFVVIDGAIPITDMSSGDDRVVVLSKDVVVSVGANLKGVGAAGTGSGSLGSRSFGKQPEIH